jgi:hypothetical protein
MKTLRLTLNFLVHFTSILCLMGLTNSNPRQLFKGFLNVSKSDFSVQGGAVIHWRMLRANITTLSYIIAQAYYLVNR